MQCICSPYIYILSSGAVKIKLSELLSSSVLSLPSLMFSRFICSIILYMYMYMYVGESFIACSICSTTCLSELIILVSKFGPLCETVPELLAARPTHTLLNFPQQRTPEQ